MPLPARVRRARHLHPPSTRAHRTAAHAHGDDVSEEISYGDFEDEAVGGGGVGALLTMDADADSAGEPWPYPVDLLDLPLPALRLCLERWRRKKTRAHALLCLTPSCAWWGGCGAAPPPRADLAARWEMRSGDERAGPSERARAGEGSGRRHHDKKHKRDKGDKTDRSEKKVRGVALDWRPQSKQAWAAGVQRPWTRVFG